ncbi:MAG: hypothetical protein LUG18_16300 [Candidatus Azobacteroides sp.]|nr:hypothetical protein [Candidatus Azobacteroides sp.]
MGGHGQRGLHAGGHLVHRQRRGPLPGGKQRGDLRGTEERGGCGEVLPAAL